MSKLTVKKAREMAQSILDKDKDAFQMRSCWKCNGAHEHLKEAGIIFCFACGHWYYQGVDITRFTKDNEN